MALSSEATALLESLPGLAPAGLAWYLLGPQGEVLASGSGEPQMRFHYEGSELVSAPVANGQVLVGPLDGDGRRAVVVVPNSAGPEVKKVVQASLEVLRELDRVEQDLEGMYPASLALLEEISMVNEIMPLLPTGKSDRGVAEMGMRALVLAAGVEQALYLQYDEATASCDVLVHVVTDPMGREASLIPATQATVTLVEGSIVQRSIAGSGAAILENVPEGGRLGLPGSPESHARRQAIAAPVRFGDSERQVTLGVLLFLDKRDTHFSGTREFGSGETKLAVVLASMLGSVLGSRKVAELGKELEMAQTIQRQILPEGTGSVPGFDIAGLCTTSGAVGGDYFDYLPMADGRQLVVVADVSGHNLASGMLMVSARATLKVLAAMHGSVSDVFDDLGAFLYGDLAKTERFITAAGVALRPRSHSVELVSAGHNATTIYRTATKAVEVVPADNTIFGFLPTPRHDVRRIDLEPGDALLLYTDGLTEAVDERGEMFGEERLASVLAASAHKTASEILAAIIAAVEVFRDRSAHRDDITAVVVRAQPRRASPS